MVLTFFFMSTIDVWSLTVSTQDAQNDMDARVRERLKVTTSQFAEELYAVSRTLGVTDDKRIETIFSASIDSKVFVQKLAKISGKRIEGGAP